MSEEIQDRIKTHEAKKALLNPNNPKENAEHGYHVDMIKTLTDKLPKTKVKLHVAAESLCESCE